MRFTKPEPIYTHSEENALDQIQPLVAMLETAANAIHEAAYQRAEAKCWREMYFESTDRSIKHGEAMMANVLMAMIKSPLAAVSAPKGEE